MTWPPTASVATPTPTPASQPDQAASSTATTPAPPIIPPSATPPSGSPQVPTEQPAWFMPLEQLHASLLNYLAHPNYWVVGGVAIAIFAMGSGFEAVNQYFAIQARSLNRSADRETTASGYGQVPEPPQSLQPDLSVSSTPIIAPNAANDIGAESLESLSPDTSLSLDASEPARFNLEEVPSQPERGTTVQTAVGEVEVVAIAPVTPTPGTVTLMFSNDIIVPLPPSEPPPTPKWQWPFTKPPAPPIDHPTDMAIALLNDLPQASTEATRVSPDRLHQGGIDLISLASNGVAASGGQPLSSRLLELDATLIPYIGIGPDKTDARQPQIFDIKGHRIAVLGYADTHLYAASDTKAGTNAWSSEQLTEDIEIIRDQVDWVVVTYHWHGDLSPTPTERQIELAHLAIDQGADVVVGHHPRVIQGGEVYQGRAIAYSLGPISDGIPNDSGDQNETSSPTISPTLSPTITTALLKLVVSDRTLEVGFIPVYQNESGASFMTLAESQTVFQAIDLASQSLTLPLASHEMTYLPSKRGISPLDSEPELFSPNSTDSFIGPNTGDQ
ncbi:MAG: CapA family protein [Cyanothece sp. SIO2G6]|nr:CapA family protein [Cyanothece sp. SIO2G6]